MSTTFAARLNRLFDVVYPPGRGPHTSAEVIAAQPYRVGSQDCRQYKHTVITGAEQKTGRGTACRNPDGSWTPLT